MFSDSRDGETGQKKLGTGVAATEPGTSGARQGGGERLYQYSSCNSVASVRYRT